MSLGLQRPEDYENLATTSKQLEAIDMGYAGPVAHTMQPDRHTFNSEKVQNASLNVQPYELDADPEPYKVVKNASG